MDALGKKWGEFRSRKGQMRNADLDDSFGMMSLPTSMLVGGVIIILGYVRDVFFVLL